MTTENDNRTIDFAKTASIDMMTLNNKVVNMRQVVKRTKVQVINKLCKNITSLKKKKGTDDQKAQNLRKAERFIEEIDSIKHLKEDKVSKYALANTTSFKDVSKVSQSAGPRALARLTDHSLMQKVVGDFRSQHPDWRDLAAYLLVKQTGRRFKTKKQKQRNKQPNIVENINASETMTKAYIQERFGLDGLAKAELRFERKRKRAPFDKNKKAEDEVKEGEEPDDKKMKESVDDVQHEGKGVQGSDGDVEEPSDKEEEEEEPKDKKEEGPLDKKTKDNVDQVQQTSVDKLGSDGEGEESSDDDDDEEEEEEVSVKAKHENKEVEIKETAPSKKESPRKPAKEIDDDGDEDEEEEEEEEEVPVKAKHENKEIEIKQTAPSKMENPRKPAKEGKNEVPKSEKKSNKQAKDLMEVSSMKADPKETEVEAGEFEASSSSDGDNEEEDAAPVEDVKLKKSSGKSECVIKELKLGGADSDSSDAEDLSESEGEDEDAEPDEQSQSESSTEGSSNLSKRQKKKTKGKIPSFLTNQPKKPVSDPFFAGSDDDDGEDDAANDFDEALRYEPGDEDDYGGYGARNAQSMFHNPHGEGYRRGGADFSRHHRGGDRWHRQERGRGTMQRGGDRPWRGSRGGDGDRSWRGSRGGDGDRSWRGSRGGGRGGDRGSSYQDGFGRGRGEWRSASRDKDRGSSRFNGQDSSMSRTSSASKPVSAPAEKLHPSWEASKKRRAEQSGIQAFKGSKITFNDD